MNSLRNFLMGILILIAIFFLGGVMFGSFERISAFNSFYYVLLTITTVGSFYQPQTVEGKILTMFLLFFGIGTVLYIATSLTKALVEGETKQLLLEFRRGVTKMKKMKNHVIVCGYGRTGKHVCMVLKEKGIPYVIIEKDGEKCLHLLEKKENVIQGDAEDPEILNHADIAHAKFLVACLVNDADNIYLVMIAKELNSNILISARAQEEIAVARLKRVGADIVIQPQIEGGKQMVNSILERKLQ